MDRFTGIIGVILISGYGLWRRELIPDISLGENGITPMATTQNQMLCFICRTPIPTDECIQGNPVRITSGEPACLDCYTDLNELHKEFND